MPSCFSCEDEYDPIHHTALRVTNSLCKFTEHSSCLHHHNLRSFFQILESNFFTKLTADRFNKIFNLPVLSSFVFENGVNYPRSFSRLNFSSCFFQQTTGDQFFTFLSSNSPWALYVHGLRTPVLFLRWSNLFPCEFCFQDDISTRRSAAKRSFSWVNLLELVSIFLRMLMGKDQRASLMLYLRSSLLYVWPVWSLNRESIPSLNSVVLSLYWTCLISWVCILAQCWFFFMFVWSINSLLKVVSKIRNRT